MEADTAAGTAVAHQSASSSGVSPSGLRSILKPPPSEAQTVPLVPRRRTLWQCWRALAESLVGVAGFGAAGGAVRSQQPSQQQRHADSKETTQGFTGAGRATPPGGAPAESPLKTLVTSSMAAPAGRSPSGDVPPPMHETFADKGAGTSSPLSGCSGGAAQPRRLPPTPKPGASAASRMNHRPLPSTPAEPGLSLSSSAEPQLPPNTPPATPTAEKRSQAPPPLPRQAEAPAQAEAAAARRAPSVAVPPLLLPPSTTGRGDERPRGALGAFASCCCSCRDDHNAGASSVDVRAAVATAAFLDDRAPSSGARAGYSYGPLVQPPIPCPDSPRPLPPPLPI